MLSLLSYFLLFALVGAGFIFVHLVLGKLIRPNRPDAEKSTVYECGEPTIGSAWVQFDLRYYVVALLFVIFDVEVAFFFPWAVMFGKLNAIANPSISAGQRQEIESALLPPARQDGLIPEVERAKPTEAEQMQAANSLAWIAFLDILVFFGVLLVGFAYLWKRGDLDWVRSTSAERVAKMEEPISKPPPALLRPPLVGVGSE